MKLLIEVLVGTILANGLWFATAAAMEQKGTFRAEGVEFEVNYYAGGIGYSPEEAAADKSPDYSARVLFATAERTLLGNAGLVVTDATGRVVFRIERADPVIYLALPKGVYTFEGGYRGATQRHPRIAVDPVRRRDIVFLFSE